MASTSSTPKVSFIQSSSSLNPPRKYDVFLSFRGEDTRKNFTDHLFSALHRHGLYTYRDDIKLERGEEIAPELLKAIEESRISVIVFSRNYAESQWCLDELAKIMECKYTFQQRVVPVFYDIDPSAVRTQRGRFAEAFAKHESRYKDFGMEGKVERWRAALREAGNLSGWDLKMADGYESKFIENVVKDISSKLNHPYLNVVDYPVGLDSRVQEVSRLLSFGSDNICMVGICGDGGVGKTTLAKAIYNQICLQFEGCSFLANVRETSKQHNGVIHLQEHLLSDILKDKNQSIRVIDQGTKVIKQRAWSGRVLVVLDDVDNSYQLKALGIRRDWLRFGSIIIVTTRDKSLLEFLDVDEVYMPKLLSYHESLQLFSWHAFGEDHPIKDYAELSQEVVGHAGGLPLALEVLGSYLFHKTMPEWKSALEKLKVIPHNAIQEKLRISFDSLNDEQKDVFLDIACFFVGMDKTYAINRLDGSGFFVEIAIGVLRRRCLIGINDLNQLTMHDMIRVMGRDIVSRKYPVEPGKRNRFWFHNEVDVLTNDTCCPDAAKFRENGLEHSEELTALLKGTTTAVKEAWAPSQGIFSDDSTGMYQDETNTLGSGEENFIEVETHTQSQNEQSTVGNNSNENKGNIEETNGTRLRRRSGEGSQPPKRRQKVSYTANMNKQHECICNEIEARSMGTKYTIKECMAILKQMIEIPRGSDLYLFACKLFLNKDQRELFVELEDSDIRLSWLKREYMS